MEQTKGSLGSQIKQQQQQQQQQQQNNQSKKKSKNKKKSSKNETVVTRPYDNEQHQKEPNEGAAEVVIENGLTDQIKQQLHIGHNNDGDDDNNSTNLNIGGGSKNNKFSNKSSSCSSSSNTNKVNGLMTENLKKSNKACPTTTNLENDKKLENAPALNGHHQHHAAVQEDEASAAVSTATKKSKRKPNNKKNPNTLDDTTTRNNLENGHCPDTTFITTNGYKHKEEKEVEQKTDDKNTAIKANKTNATTNATTTNIINTVENSEKQQQPSTMALETVSISQNPEPAKQLDLSNVHIDYKEYESELQMHDIMRLIQAELSEPYSIYTYRYFIYNWPKLCFLAAHGNEYVGAIVCKLDMHMNVRRGYIAMLAVRKEYRKLKIGTTLVQKAIEAMLADKADEVVLETEMSNLPALRLYENLGFVRDKRLFRYYLNGVDALRLKLWFR